MTAERRVPSPLGEILLTASPAGLTGAYFDTSRHPRRAPAPAGADASPILERAAAQLAAYFAGALREFDLPLAPEGTAFQRRVWDALRAIPYGVTMSYRDVARRIGDPRATRAVGAANGRNPIVIILPCHRVVGADGSLTGYGGGMARKRWLLEHEGALPATLGVG